MLTNTDLVTITCTRDRGIQELQSYSLDLMVMDPCNHYVVVEDGKVSMEQWRTMLSPYYTRHHLHLISGTSLLSSEYYVDDSKIKNGWHRSAVLKLLIADKIQSNKYLIIDSKKRLFAAQRSSTMSLPFKWELPGGKVESDESPEDCLIREISEELELSIVIIKISETRGQ